MPPAAPVTMAFLPARRPILDMLVVDGMGCGKVANVSGDRGWFCELVHKEESRQITRERERKMTALTTARVEYY